MLTPATTASRTSDPPAIISNAFATHVWPLSFFDRLPFDAATTSGLTLFGVSIVGDWPNSGFDAVAAATPAAVVVRTKSRRLILCVGVLCVGVLGIRGSSFVECV